MKSTQFVRRILVLSLLLAGALAQAAPITGTVTNKTTGKPASGDTVVLVNPMTGMSEIARTTSDVRGHYSLNAAINDPLWCRQLIRAPVTSSLRHKAARPATSRSTTWPQRSME